MDQELRIESTYLHVLAKIIHNLLFSSKKKIITTNVGTYDCARVRNLICFE